MNETYIRHLQDIVRIPTVSTENDASTDWTQFDRLHDFLKEAYPLIHSRMERTVIGRASLLYRWKAKEPKRLPVLLMAHQDVVPTGDPAQWTHDPFGGELDQGCVWGRGTNDCKSLLIAECEAVEELLAEGFEPDFDIYLSFGHNEEVQADDDRKGSVLAGRYLADRGVRIGCIFDEGGMVQRGADSGEAQDTALVSLAEKSPNDFVLYKDGPGGHASKPGRHTVLGDVARAMAAVEAHPMPYRLTPLAEAQLAALAPLQTGARRAVYADPKGHWDELCALAAEDRGLDAILHTTFAVTKASGSPQTNVLPAHAECTMNVRILQGDTVASVKAYLESLMPDGVKVKVTFGEDPHPEGSVDSAEFRLLTRVIRDVYGADTAVVPMVMTGATDSRNYAAVCDHIFRFSGRIMTKDWGEAHQIDEKVPADAVEPAVAFFKVYLRAYRTAL